MAEPLRRAEDFMLDEFPESPNMNVVPPAAPMGSADRATTAGATSRGDFVDSGLRNRPDHLLEPYSEERERQWPLGGFAFVSTALNRAGTRIRGMSARSRNAIANGSLKHDLRDYAEEWKDRAADIADDLKQSAGHLMDNLQVRSRDLRFRGQELGSRAGERAQQSWQRAQGVAQDSWRRAQDRVQDVRYRTERYIDAEPVKSIAVAAGVGFVLGVALRLGRSRREY